MPTLSCLDFLSSSGGSRARAAKEPLASAYVLAGGDDYFRREVRRTLAERLREAHGDADVRFLDRSEIKNFAALCAEARATPMWTPAQMLVMDIDKRLARSDAAPVEAYLASPSPSSLLVLEWRAPDERLKLALVCKKYARKADGPVAWVKCEPLREPALRAWLEGYARKRGVRFASGALDMLLDTVGTKTALLVGEIEKALLYAPEEKTLAAETLRLVAVASRDFAWYDLTDALGARDGDAALRVLKRLLERGESAVGLVILMASHVRKLLKGRVLLDQGHDERAILQDLGVRFYGDKFLRQVKAFSSSELTRALEACFQTDRALKTSALPNRVALEKFVLSLLARAAPGRARSASSGTSPRA